jgi:hypothetical protein
MSYGNEELYGWPPIDLGELEAEGRLSMKHARTFYEGISWELLRPDQGVIAEAPGTGIAKVTAAYTTDGSAVTVYFPEGGVTKTINTTHIDSGFPSLEAIWFNPATGDYDAPIPHGRSSDDIVFTSPSGWGGAMLWVRGSETDGATYCADDNVGSDAASGAPGDCFKTGQAGMDAVQPGDSLCFMPGTYAAMSTVTSGTRTGRITLKYCAGVVGDSANNQNCLYKGSVDDVNGGGSNRAQIEGGSGHDYYTIDSLEFCANSYQSGKAHIYQWGNDYWYIKDTKFLGDVKTGAELWTDKSGQGRDGTDNNIALIRIKGTGTYMTGLQAYYTPFQHIAFGDDFTLSTLVKSELGWSGSHTMTMDKYCGGSSFRKTKLRIDKLKAWSSWTSDAGQSSKTAEAPDNPNDPYQSSLYPCMGDIRISDTICAANGEGCWDAKGWRRAVIERTVIALMYGNGNSGASHPELVTCSAAALGGGSETHIELLARDNVLMDVPVGINWRENNAVYGNTFLNDSFYMTGVRGTCTAGKLGDGWGDPGIWINNAFPTLGRFVSIDSSGNSQSRLDYNVYDSSDPAWYRDGSVNTEYNTLASWQSYLTGYNAIGGDANSVMASTDDILVDNTMDGSDATDPEERVHFDFNDVNDPFPDFVIQDVLDMIPRMALETTWSTGGGSVGTVAAAATSSTTIDVGDTSTSFCCVTNGGITSQEYLDMGLSAEEAAYAVDLRVNDLIEIKGPSTTTQQARILSMSSDTASMDFNLLHLDGPVTVKSGDTIDKICTGGEDCTDGLTSTARGAFGYWEGDAELPPPVPPERPTFPVDASNLDGFEDIAGAMDITSDSLPVGGSGGAGDPTDTEVSISDVADDCSAQTGSATSCSRTQDVAYNNNNSMAFRDIQIPAGSTINTAYVDVYGNHNQSGSKDVPVKIQSGCTAPTPALTTDSIPALAQLTETHDWATPVTWLNGVRMTTDDLSVMIQEAVDQGCWALGADIGVLFLDGGGTNRYYRTCDYAGACEFPPRIRINFTPPATGAGETVVLMDSTITVGETVSDVILSLTPDVTNTGSFDMTINGLLPPAADLTTTTDDISDRTARTSTVTCSGLSGWTLNGQEDLTDTECPGLTALFQAVIDDGDFIGRVGLVLASASTRSIHSWDGDSNRAAGFFATVEEQSPPIVTMIDSIVCYVDELCSVDITAIDFGTGVCSSVVADETALPGGHDAALGSPDGSCISQWTWTAEVGDEGTLYTVPFTATAANALTTVVDLDVQMYNVLVGSADVPVLSSECDAEQTYAPGYTMDLTSSDLEFVYDPEKTNQQVVGVCFDEVPVEQASVVTKAYIQFTAKGTSTGEVPLLHIDCEDEDDAAVFTSGSGDISSRATTGNLLDWNPGNWNTDGARTANERTLELRVPLQDVVNRTGWVAGNRMACVFYAEGNPANFRRAYSFDGGAAPALHIEWTPEVTLSGTSVTTTGGTMSEDIGTGDTDTDETGVGLKP